MKDQKILDKIIELIDKSDKIAIVTHILPDGDAVGSALSLWKVLTDYGKKCDCLCDSPLSLSLKDVPFNEFFDKKTQETYDLAISVDVSEPTRTGKYRSLFDGNSISIDHHKGRTAFSKVNYVDLRSSTCEIILDIINYAFSQHLTKDVADLLYIGLVTDTGGFAYEYVDQRSHECAIKLLDKGVNGCSLYRKYFLEKPTQEIRMHAEVVSKAIFELSSELAILVFTKEILDKYKCDITQTSSAIGNVMNCQEVKVGISITEIDNRRFKVSIRTKGTVDANAIASEFGGGGHVNASGCRLNGDIGIVIDKLVFAVSKNL